MVKHLFQKGHKVNAGRTRNQEIRDKISNSMKGISKPKDYSERRTQGNLTNNPMNSIEVKRKMIHSKFGKNREYSKEELSKIKKARDKSHFHVQLKPNCEICNSTENLERHHWRYDKPLLVNTLCSTCHDIQHVPNFQTSKFGGLI
jgi:hypothetical protein